MKIKALLSLIVLLLSLPLSAGPTTQPAFIVGVWQQDTSSFQTWKSRGVNCLVEIPTGPTWTPAARLVWVGAAEAAGLYQIRSVVGTAAQDNSPHLLAWNQPDEPEGTGHTPAELAANYAALKAANPKRPVLINFDGSRVLGIQGGLTQANYAPYLSCGDWFGSDIYPATAWGRTDWLDKPGLAVSTLSVWTGGKPQLSFIETSNQRIGPSGLPTAPQVRYEVLHAVMSGASGIVLFPQQISPFAFDATTPDIAAMLPSTCAELRVLGPYLGTGLKSSSLGGGLEYGTTNTAAGELRVLLNANNASTNYSGVPLAPYGLYAVLVTPTAQKVLLQTPIPPTLDQQVAALQLRLAADEAQLAAQAATMAAVAKALVPATQPGN